MIDVIRTYINKHNLFSKDKPVLVGLSGGADSVALLAVLARLGYACIAVHCNFHLRGEESDRDEAFAGNFAGKLGVPFHKAGFDTRQYAREKHISIEMAARELRYNRFEEMRVYFDAQAIAVAHHRDDNVETLLINLARGTGIKGVRGMRPKNGYIVRPLLSVGKEDILCWLKEQQLPFVTDSTNLSDEYVRNFIRLNVIPLLETINPSVKEAIARTSAHLSSVETIYRSVIEKARIDILKDGNRLSITELLAYPAPETILYELLAPFHFTRLVAERIFLSLDKEPGKLFLSPTHRLIKDRAYLIITPLEKAEPDTYILREEQGECLAPVQLSWEKTVLDQTFHLRKDKNVAYFDYDKLRFPLTIRTWQPGNWFVPFGMAGRKKLSDYFSDHKYSLPDKEQTWLLCSGENILWIIGERADNRFRIDKTTTSVLTVNFLEKKR
ncbi:MAG: tRNA lysidine(34) synthetase TilS [Tannerellaceae bacterium]|jgi:tRNA(Ile)-lysidine synthase|nr:tRNA lysidine(34) synthetase TilS [Tannerellaceae bacterium]